MSDTVRAARRNAAVFGLSLTAVGGLFLYPTSLHSGTGRRPGTPVAPAGVVTPPTTTAAGATPGLRTVNGAAVDTAYGLVQVQVVLRGSRIVQVKAIDYPTGSGTDQQINAYAIPQLRQEALAAQSAQIDTVSGATYTSGGYRASLQAALDAAHRSA